MLINNIISFEQQGPGSQMNLVRFFDRCSKVSQCPNLNKYDTLAIIKTLHTYKS